MTNAWRLSRDFRIRYWDRRGHQQSSLCRYPGSKPASRLLQADDRFHHEAEVTLQALEGRLLAELRQNLDQRGGSARPGLIRRPATSTSDSILARVSAGEHAFVSKVSRVRQLWPLLDALNFGSDRLVRDLLQTLPPGVSRLTRPLPVKAGLQPVNLFLPGSSEPPAKLFAERDQVRAREGAIAHYRRGFTS